MAADYVDHLVYAVPELTAAIDAFEQRLGVRPAVGGQHPGRGTHNALLSLGPKTYLEIIAPDPAQPQPARPLPYGLARSTRERIATFAVTEPDLEGRCAAARAGGYDPGAINPMHRDRPDGVTLAWRLTLRDQPPFDGLVPFLIDWGDTDSPAIDAPAGCTLVELRGEHPDPVAVQAALAALQVPMAVAPGSAPLLVALVQTPGGRHELR